MDVKGLLKAVGEDGFLKYVSIKIIATLTSGGAQGTGKYGFNILLCIITTFKIMRNYLDVSQPPNAFKKYVDSIS